MHSKVQHGDLELTAVEHVVHFAVINKVSLFVSERFKYLQMF